jgi:hypothetical protein
MLFRNKFISELENLLINCKYLDGIYIYGVGFNWEQFI